MSIADVGEKHLSSAAEVFQRAPRMRGVERNGGPDFGRERESLFGLKGCWERAREREQLVVRAFPAHAARLSIKPAEGIQNGWLGPP